MRTPVTKAFKFGAILALAVSLSSCAWLQRVADRFAPRNSAELQQYRSISDNLRQAEGFKPSVGVHIAAETLQAAVAKEIPQRIKEARLDGVDIKELTASIDLIQQAVDITVKFDLQIANPKVHVRGSLEGLVALSTDGDRLLLRPAFESVQISKLDYVDTGRAVEAAVRKAVNGIMDTYVDRVNGVLFSKPVVLDLAWEQTTTVDLGQVLARQGITITAQRRQVGRRFAGSLTRIGESGVSVLVALSDGPAKPEEVESRTEGGDTEISASEVRSLYARYSDVFTQIWQQHLDPIDPKAPVQVQVAKREIASLLNSVTDQPFSLDYSFAVPPVEIHERIEAKKSEVDCQKVREPFRRSRYDRASCGWSCMRRTFLGRVEDPFCAASRNACNVREEARVAADNVTHEAERIKHQAEQEAKVGACNVWRETTGILALGRVDGSASATGSVKAAAAGIQFAEDLSAVSLKQLTVDVNGKPKVDVDITPHDLGHVFLCVARYNLRWSADVKARATLAAERVGIQMTPDGDDLAVGATFPDVAYEAAVSPPPIQRLITDAAFAAKCPVGLAVMFAGISAADAASRIGATKRPEFLDAALGRFKGKERIPPVQHKIAPIPVDLGAHGKWLVKPKAGPKSVQFVVNPAS